MTSNVLYKISKIILAGNINQLSNVFQEEWLENKNKSNYYELEEQEKEALKQYIKNRKEEVEKEISSKTNNVQYKSWIYDVLIKKDQMFEDIDKIIKEIENLEYLKKNKNVLNEKLETKLENKDFDIKTYKTFGELHSFTSEYIPLFKNRALNTKNLKPDFEKVFSGEKYDVYKITKEDKELFHELYGKRGYNTAWFGDDDDDKYIWIGSDCLYLFTFKNYKPYALLELNSCQFSNVHDRPLLDFSDDILEFLSKKDYEDQDFSYNLSPYETKVLQFKNRDLSTSELFIKMEENSKINSDGTIDVNGHVSPFSLRHFVENGKFTIKFNKVDGIFNCTDLKLTSLEGCPKVVSGIFNCSINNLTSLEGCPKVVNGIFNCEGNNLTSLKGIPERFKKNLSEIRCRWNKIPESELIKTIL